MSRDDKTKDVNAEIHAKASDLKAHLKELRDKETMARKTASAQERANAAAQSAAEFEATWEKKADDAWKEVEQTANSMMNETHGYDTVLSVMMALIAAVTKLAYAINYSMTKHGLDPLHLPLNVAAWLGKKTHITDALTVLSDNIMNISEMLPRTEKVHIPKPLETLVACDGAGKLSFAELDKLVELSTIERDGIKALVKTALMAKGYQPTTEAGDEFVNRKNNTLALDQPTLENILSDNRVNNLLKKTYNIDIELAETPKPTPGAPTPGLRP